MNAMRKAGLRVIRPDDEFKVHPVKVYAMEEYDDTPDVILVCVKDYSIKDIIPFMQRVAGDDTVIIPVLNIYGTGEKLQPDFPDNLVTDGCIYVASEIAEPGVILMKGYILRVVFGVRQEKEYLPVLEKIRDDFNDSDIKGLLSDNIRRDALLKFSYVSPHSACGTYYDVAAGAIMQTGEIRECFVRLVREIGILAEAMGIEFEEDIVERNLKILDGVSHDMTTSMQRDITAGKDSEIDGQIFEVVRLAHKYGVELPEYEKITAALEQRYGL